MRNEAIHTKLGICSAKLDKLARAARSKAQKYEDLLSSGEWQDYAEVEKLWDKSWWADDAYEVELHRVLGIPRWSSKENEDAWYGR